MEHVQRPLAIANVEAKRVARLGVHHGNPEPSVLLRPQQPDRHALRERILRFALLLRQVPEIVEADLNPVRCTTTGCLVLDMRLRIEHPRPVERVKTW
jgi:ATP-grasp domain